MGGEQNSSSTSLWLAFAFVTILSWGCYGALLAAGAEHMEDKVNGRIKAFLFVGVAYFLTAVLAPAGVLVVRGAGWSMPMAGMGWSLFAGILGAVGAFFILLAFGAGGNPGVVMSLVFAGAPIINALYFFVFTNRKAGQEFVVEWPFYAGIVLAAAGGFLVTRFKPTLSKPDAPPAALTAPVDPEPAPKG